MRLLAGGVDAAGARSVEVALIREFKGLTVDQVQGERRGHAARLPGRAISLRVEADAGAAPAGAADSTGAGEHGGPPGGGLLRGPGHRRRGIARIVRSLPWAWLAAATVAAAWILW